MRKRTLAGLCVTLSFMIVFALKFAGISIPLGLSPLFVGFVLFPVLMVPLTLLNKRLLAWRKVRGRDIEEEEKYENEEAGIISLRPRPDTQPESRSDHFPTRFK